MTDPKLVEIVARALWSGDSCGFDDFYIGKARAALAAINASGTHWVAPWRATWEMSAAVDRETEGNCREDTARGAFDVMRTAYLAEPKA